MGYYITHRESVFHIKKENFKPALKAIKEACMKRDGWAWINKDVIARIKTLEEFLSCMRWPAVIIKPDMEDKLPSQYSAGDIGGLDFTGEKLGDDEEIFAVLAPFVENGSYIEIGGEEDAAWRWVFNHGRLSTIDARIVWEDLPGMLDAILRQKTVLPTLMGLHPELDNKITKALKED